MIGRLLAAGSVSRRVVARAALVLGAVLLGGQLMRGLPRDQVLIFPVGSVFPAATHFSASWREVSSREPQGGVTLSFPSPPPLQIREHTKLPNGDYIVTMEVLQAEGHADSTTDRRGLQTNIERRVNLLGGETMILLTTNREVERF